MSKIYKLGASVSPQMAEDAEPNRDVNALFSSLRMDQATYQSFTRHRGPKAVERAPEKKIPEPRNEGRVHVGIWSPMGGSGKSTLTSSLGSLISQLGRRVLLVDTSQWQTLAFHYGASEARAGKRSFFAPGSEDLAVHILALDQNDTGFPDLNNFTATIPLDCVLFDLSGVSGEQLLVYLQECDIIIVPLLPDASAVRLAGVAKTVLDKLQPSPSRVMFVINQMEDTALAKEVRAQLIQSLGEQLFPSAIDRHAVVQQAQAHGVVLPFYSPKAQSISVLNEITRWLNIPEAALARPLQRWSER